MTRYRKIEVQMWGDRKFWSLSKAPPNAQTLWMYLLSGPRTTVFPGIVVANLAIIALDLRWPLDRELRLGDAYPYASTHASTHASGDASTHASATRVESVRDAWQELVDHDMVRADFKAGLIVLNRALFTSEKTIRESAKPASANQLVGWEKAWSDLPECDLKDQYLQELRRFTYACSRALGVAFAKAFGRHLSGLDASTHASGYASGDASTHASGYASPTRLGSGTGTGTGDLQIREIDLPRADAREPGEGPTSQGPTSQQQMPLLAVIAGGQNSRPPDDPTSDDPTVQPVAESPPHVAEPRSVRQDAPIPAPAQARAETAIARPDASLTRAAAWEGWQRLNRLRAEIATELALGPVLTLHHHLPGFLELQRRLAESGEDAAAHLDHVFEIAEIIARGTRSLRYCAACLFEPTAWQTKLGMTAHDAHAEVERALRGRAGPLTSASSTPARRSATSARRAGRQRVRRGGRRDRGDRAPGRIQRRRRSRSHDRQLAAGAPRRAASSGKR